MTTATRTDRVLDAINIARINLPAGTLDRLDDGLAIDFHEHSAWHMAKSLAHSHGHISLDEAHTIYRALGDSWNPTNGGWARHTDTAAKVVITRVIGQLLAATEDDPRKTPVEALP